MEQASPPSFDFEKLQKLVPAGREDMLTLSMLLSAGAINHPLMDQVLRGLGAAPYEGAITTALGALLAYGAAQRIHRRAAEVFPRRIDWTRLGVTMSPVHIRSDVDLPSPEQWSNWDGMLLGYCVDSGKPVIVDWDHWMRHCFIVGQSGVGKTVLGEWLMFQQIVRGGSLLFVDGKMDEGNLRKIHAMACWAGRRDDLLVVNPGKPELSNTYNPILYGDPDEVASRIISLIPSAENNPGADHYRQQATQAVTTVVNGIKSIAANAHLRSSGLQGLAYNFFDLSLILQNQHALEMVLERINRSSDGGAQFLSWLEQFKSVSRDGVASIDMKKMKDTFGGIGGRLHAFGTGKFGEVTSSYSPEVNLFEALTSNKIVYIALPTMGKAEAASNFGKMVVGDVQGALFTEKQDLKIKVYGQEKTVIMSGNLQAADKKEGDKYVPTAYGRLGVKAVKASTKDGKEYLQLVIDGGLSGLFKAEGKDYDYAGAIDTGDGHEFAIFGRKRKSEAGNSFIALSSGERRAKEAHSNGEHAAVAATADDDEIPF